MPHDMYPRPDALDGGLFEEFLGVLRALAANDPRGPAVLRLVRDNYDEVRELFEASLGIGTSAGVSIPAPPLPKLPITPYDLWGPELRLRVNVGAIRLLRSGVLDLRPPTPEERAVLLAYSGWGGITRLDDLAEDPATWKPDEIADIRAIKAGRPATGNTFRGALNQYFTPIAASEAMWALLRRVGDPFLTRGPLRVLEPSAGVGRFAQAAPTDLDLSWTFAEMDPIQSAILAQAYPDAALFNGMFEAWCAANPPGPKFDVVIANPPFTDRGVERRLDTLDEKWVDGSLYFLIAAARRLRPGGVMVQLHTWDVVKRVGGEQARARAELVKLCHFAGAGFPPYTLFHRIGGGTGLAVTCWVRRPRTLLEVAAEDQDFVDGSYADSEDGQANMLGPLAPFRRQVLVSGVFDPSALVNIKLRPLDEDSVQAIHAARESGAAPDDVPRAGRGRRTLSAEQATRSRSYEAPTLQWAQALGARVIRFRGLLGSDVKLAETSRPELLSDLQQFAASLGPPSRVDEIVTAARDDVQVRAFLSAYNDDGAVIGVLTSSVSAVNANDYRGDPDDVLSIVSWYSAHAGACRIQDIEKHRGRRGRTEIHTLLLQSQGFMVEPRVEEDTHPWWYYARADYLSGDLWARHDRVEKWLDEHSTTPEAPRLRAQQADLMAAIAPLEIDVLLQLGPESPVKARAGFVPVDVLEAFLQKELGSPTVRIRFNAERVWYELYTGAAEELSGEAQEEFERAQARRGWIRERAQAKQDRDTSELAQALLAYINRSPWIYLGDKRKNRYTVLRPRYGAKDKDKRWLGFTAIGGEEGVLFQTEQRDLADINATIAEIEGAAEDEDEDESKGRGGKDKDEPDRITSKERAMIDDAVESGFRAFLSDNPVYGQRTADAYNRALRGNVTREMPGDGLVIPRMSPNFTPGWHQTRGVRKVVDVGSQIIGWDVGLGKTAGILMAIAVLRQRGQAKRPLIVVPKKVVANWRREIQRFFPDMRPLVIGRRWSPSKGRWLKVTPAEKQGQWQTFAMGAYDLAVCSYEDFLTAQPSAQTRYRILSKALWLRRELGADDDEREVAKGRIKTLTVDVKTRREVVERLVQQGRDNDRDSHYVEALKKLRDTEAKLAASDRRAKNPTLRALESARLDAEKLGMDKEFAQDRTLIAWEDLGVDFLAIDEIHNFKGLWSAEPRGGQIIVGMGGGEEADSKRAWDLYVKAQEVLERMGMRGVVGATATPLVNSPLDIYNLLCYIAPDAWLRIGVRHKEDFIDRFIATAVRFHVTVAGDPVQRSAVTGLLSPGDFATITDRYLDYLTAEDVNTAAMDGVDPARPGHAPGFTYDGVWRTGDRAAPVLTYGDHTYRSLERWRRNGSPGTVVDVVQVDDAADHGFLPVRWSPAFPGAVPILGDEGSRDPAPDREAARLRALQWLHRPVKVPDAVLPPAAIVIADDEQWEVYEGIRLVGRAIAAAIKVMARKMSNDPAEKAKLQQVMKLLRYIVIDRLSKASLDPRLAASKPFSEGVEEIISRINLEDAVRYSVDVEAALAGVSLVNNYEPDPNYVPAKFIAVAEKIAESPGCGHLVFVDSNAVHKQLREVIASMAGIPIERIGVIQGNNGTEFGTDEERRLEISDLFNGADATEDEEGNPVPAKAPSFDVLVCQTEAAGEGLNLQRRTCAIHHLTLPWTPNKLQQRNGRGVRQGNAREAVSVYYYFLGFSNGRMAFDTYRANLISVKSDWQRDLLRTKGQHALNNPAANADVDFSSMLAMLADNPEEAMALLRAQQERAQLEELVQRRTRAFATLATATSIGNGIISPPTWDRAPERQNKKRKDVQNITRDLARLPPDVFPPSAKALLGDIGERLFKIVVAEGEVYPVYEGTAYAHPDSPDQWRVPTKMLASSGGVMVRTVGGIGRTTHVSPAAVVGKDPAKVLTRPWDHPDLIKRDREALQELRYTGIPYEVLADYPEAWIRLLRTEINAMLLRVGAYYRTGVIGDVAWLPVVNEAGQIKLIDGYDSGLRTAAVAGSWRVLLPLPEDLEIFSTAVKRGTIPIGKSEWVGSGRGLGDMRDAAGKDVSATLRRWFGLSYGDANTIAFVQAFRRQGAARERDTDDDAE